MNADGEFEPIAPADPLAAMPEVYNPIIAQRFSKAVLDAAEDAFLKAVVDAKFDLYKAKKTLGWPAEKIKEYALRESVVLELERLRRRMKFERDVSEERLLEEVSYIAFADPCDVFDDDGCLKPLSDIPEVARRAIVEIGVSDTLNGRNVKAKLASKLDALKMLGNFYGTFIERKEISGNVNVSLAAIAQSFAGRGAPPPIAEHTVASVPAIVVDDGKRVPQPEDLISGAELVAQGKAAMKAAKNLEFLR